MAPKLAVPTCVVCQKTLRVYRLDTRWEQWHEGNTAPGSIHTKQEAIDKLAAEGFTMVTSFDGSNERGSCRARLPNPRFGYFGDNLLCTLRCAARLGSACAKKGWQLKDEGGR